jgi:hypothetical protein
MMGLTLTSGDVIAALALVLSIVATVTTMRFNGRQKSLIASQELLNQRLLERQEEDSQAGRRADISANLVKVADSRWRLKVFNRGRAVARNVSISADSDLLVQEDIDSKFPLEALEPQQGVDLLARVSLGSAGKHAIALSWDDDFQMANQKAVYVTV